MAQKKIIHCMHSEKFIEPFINLVEKNFDSPQHIFLVRQSEKFPTKIRPNIKILSEQTKFIWKIIFYIQNMSNSKKIILHGLFHKEIFLVLLLQPWLLKKCYWIIWGGDLYRYEFQNGSLKSDIFELLRSFVFRRIGHFITYIKGDYELVQSWYGASGEHHECMMYSSNIFKEYVVPPKVVGPVNILVGNSATHTNNHFGIFEKLAAFKRENIMIYCPLSYGTPANNADYIAKLGKEMFGDKFIPLLEFMTFEKYLELLGQIDIAVFAHKRQQAMGNTITLLGLGKKVYMRNDVTPWSIFAGLGVKIFDIEQIDIELIGEDDARKNKEIISDYFSEKKLIEQYAEIFR